MSDSYLKHNACMSKSSIRSVGNRIHTYLSLYSARLTKQPTSEIDSERKKKDFGEKGAASKVSLLHT